MAGCTRASTGRPAPPRRACRSTFRLARGPSFNFRTLCPSCLRGEPVFSAWHGVELSNAATALTSRSSPRSPLGKGSFRSIGSGTCWRGQARPPRPACPQRLCVTAVHLIWTPTPRRRWTWTPSLGSRLSVSTVVPSSRAPLGMGCIGGKARGGGSPAYRMLPLPLNYELWGREGATSRLPPGDRRHATLRWTWGGSLGIAAPPEITPRRVSTTRARAGSPHTPASGSGWAP